MSATPLEQLPIALGRTYRTLADAGDHRAEAAGEVVMAFGDFVTGREGAAHADALSRRIGDSRFLFELITDASYGLGRDGDPASAYHLAAHRLLDAERAVLRHDARRRRAGRLLNARSWARY